jgi:hypothetical protein
MVLGLVAALFLTAGAVGALWLLGRERPPQPAPPADEARNDREKFLKDLADLEQKAKKGRPQAKEADLEELAALLQNAGLPHLHDRLRGQAEDLRKANEDRDGARQESERLRQERDQTRDQAWLLQERLKRLTGEKADDQGGRARELERTARERDAALRQLAPQLRLAVLRLAGHPLMPSRLAALGSVWTPELCLTAPGNSLEKLRNRFQRAQDRVKEGQKEWDDRPEVSPAAKRKLRVLAARLETQERFLHSIESNRAQIEGVIEQVEKELAELEKTLPDPGGARPGPGR